MQGFMTISLKLKEMYQMITLGGDAELELVDTLDPFSEVRTPPAHPPPALIPLPSGTALWDGVAWPRTTVLAHVGAD